MFLGREGISSHTGFSVVAFVSVWVFLLLFLFYLFLRDDFTMQLYLHCNSLCRLGQPCTQTSGCLQLLRAGIKACAATLDNVGGCLQNKHCQAILTLLLAPGICYGSQSVFPFMAIIITMPPTQRKYLDVSPYASKSVDFLLMTLTLIFCVYSVFYSCWLLISIFIF